jgi:hypothetical protein
MFVLDSRIDLETGVSTKPFGFICHPKTASQTTRAALRGLGARSPAGHHGYDSQEIDFILDNGGIVASTVRNPFDTIVSWWAFGEMMCKKRQNAGKPAPFLYWLPRILESGNGYIEKGLFYAAELCSDIIRYEGNIPDQLNSLLTECGWPSVELPVVGESPRGPYQNYYDIPAALMVDRYCREELDRWGYSFCTS